VNTIIQSFYTTFPTPYQEYFFNALNKEFSLRTFFCAKAEKDRLRMVLNPEYIYIFLRGTYFMIWVNYLIKNFLFSMEICKVARQEKADLVMLSCNYFDLSIIIVTFILRIKRKQFEFYTDLKAVLLKACLVGFFDDTFAS